MIKKLFGAVALVLTMHGYVQTQTPASGKNDAGGGSEIKPYSGNPRYWQYEGAPVLLLGATDNDNLFQNENVEAHLDSLRGAGGNYIRNTMSDRDAGDEKAFYRRPDGWYDLDKWNPGYWNKFRNLLELAWERDIIVQIEIWDRFDHSRDPWKTDPYNPANNINYSYHESGLDSLYPQHPNKNLQPFFFTVPRLDSNLVLLRYQQQFVQKMLSISLKYNNVLYCIDNETNGDERWATYWAGYIRDAAKAAGKKIYITEMWDSWNVTADMHKRTTDHPERYDFIDISQNSQITGYDNWEHAQYVLDHIKANPRQVNSTKIYGKDQGTWDERGITTAHAVQTFCRNIIGGFASSRFHRPPFGTGLAPASINCIRTIRKIETQGKMWNNSPRMDLLRDYAENEAYLSAQEGDFYLIYFPEGGKVKLDLKEYDRPFIMKRIDLKDAVWGESVKIGGGSMLEVISPNEEGSFVILQSLDAAKQTSGISGRSGNSAKG